MVFVTDDEPQLWFVENPEALRGYEGKHMRISGKLDSEAKSVHVEESSPVDEH